MKLNEIKTTLQDFDRAICRIKERLALAVLDLPNNPEIRLIGSEDSRAFAIISSSLTRDNYNWSPYYHDFRHQYEKLIEIISLSEPRTLAEKLDTILRTGVWKQGSDRVKFHPGVVELLRAILADQDETAETALSNGMGL